MVFKWIRKAERELINILEYWIEHNKSDSYSRKIVQEIKAIEEIKENPYFLSIYFPEHNVFKKLFLNNRFSIYYRIENDVVIILHFRSNKQKPIF